MMFAASLFSYLDKGIGGLFNIIWAFLCIPVYAIIRTNFNIFIKIAEMDIVSNVNINEIYKRLTMMITIVMTFYIAFSVVKYTINPETISDKEKGAGKIAYRIIVAILLIAFVPNIFSMAYKLQNRLIKTQVFSKIILGEQAWDYSTYGSSFAADTFSAFYRVDELNCEDNCESAKKHVATVIENIRQGGSTIHTIETIVWQWESGVEFDGLLALIFGCFVIYVIFLYSIDVAIRCIQLLFLQIMAPVAILLYIVPSKDNMFNKWLKQCTTTYFDLFIRLMIMYFAMLVIKVLGHSLKIYEITSDGSHIGPIAYIFFVMGILIFVQRAPKLLSELFPSSGSAAAIGYGFEWKTRGEPLKKSIDTLKKPIAATAGAIASSASTIKSIRTGNLHEALEKKYKNKPFMKKAASTFDTIQSAYKGGQEAAKQNSIRGAFTNKQRQAETAEKEYSDGGAPIERFFRGQHYENEKQRFKQYFDNLEEIPKSRGGIKDATEETKATKTMRSYMNDANVRGLGDANAREKLIKEAQKIQIALAHDKISVTKAQNDMEKLVLDSQIYKDVTEQTNVIDTLKAALADDNGSINQQLLKQNMQVFVDTVKSTKDKDGAAYKFVDVDKDGKVTEHKFEVKDENGNKVAKTVAEMSDYEIIQAAGDIETFVKKEITRVKTSDEYAAAEANANAPGKKEG